MSEDEPMEREVAIDPEMLGKVFENLLEINDRKSKGAFYTPREIVHHMCQESLINYLTNTLSIHEEAIRDFILYGDFMKDEDTVKEKRQGNGGMYISEELYKINPDGTIAVNRLIDMDNALKNVRVADPAVGSGAFPLGMLNEIVRARQNISAYLAITMKPYDVRMMYQMDRSPHTLKYETKTILKHCEIWLFCHSWRGVVNQKYSITMKQSKWLLNHLFSGILTLLASLGKKVVLISLSEIPPMVF